MKSLRFSITKPLCFFKSREFVNNLKTLPVTASSSLESELKCSRQDSLTTEYEGKHRADCPSHMFRTKTAVKLGAAAQAIAGRNILNPVH